MWETNTQRTFEHVADATPVGGKMSYTLDPDSLYTFTTTTGQGRGTAKPPAAAAFPLPYADNFEDTEVARAPRFLSDQDGAFEAHPCLKPARPLPGAGHHRKTNSLGTVARSLHACR